MRLLEVDALIVIGFLLITLVVGLRAGRGIKDIREYAIANRVYGTGVLTMTFLATLLGGHNTIAAQTSMLRHGVVAALPLLISFLMFVYAGFYIVPAIARFRNSLTLGDIMGSLYGSTGELIAGLAGLGYTISFVGASALSIGWAVHTFTGYNETWSVILGGGLLVLYTALGGIKSVTLTDVLQFIVFVVVVPIMAHVVILEVGGIKTLLTQVPPDKLTVWGHERFSRYFFIALVWSLFPAVVVSPPMIQRILMAKNKRQAVSMLIISGFFRLVISILILLTCLAVLVLDPQLTPSVGGGFTYVIFNYFSPALRGLSAAGMLAIVMSTIDSILNSGGLLLTRNVVKPIFLRLGKSFDELKAVRPITCLVGVLSMLVPFSQKTTSFLSYFGASIFTPIVAVPLIAGARGVTITPRAFLYTTAATIVTFVVASFGLPSELGYLVFPISLFANALVFCGAHIVQNGRFKVRSYHDAQEPFFASDTFATSYKTLLALFLCFNYMVPYFMHTRQQEHTVLGIKLVGAGLCIGVLLEPYWHVQLKKYFNVYWHAMLLYCLPFSTTVLYLLNEGGTEWTVNVALSIMLLIILAGWKQFVIMALSGIVLGALYARPTHISYDNAYTLAYTSIFSTLIGLLFARRRQRHTDQREKLLRASDTAHQNSLVRVANERLQALQAFQNLGVERLLTIAKDLQDLSVTEDSVEKLHDIQKRLVPLSCQLQGLDTRATEYLQLNVEWFARSTWLENIQATLAERAMQRPLRWHVHTAATRLNGDSAQLTHLVAQCVLSLDVMQKEQEFEPISVHLYDTQLHYPLPDVGPDYIKRTEALAIVVASSEESPIVDKRYRPDLATSACRSAVLSPQEVEWTAIRRIVKAHYGYYEQSEKACLCVIPLDVRTLRLRDTDKKYMALDARPVRANDRYTSETVDAQAQERAFLTNVDDRPQAELALLKTALELIKCYHGPISRNTKEPFYLHPLAVAYIVLEYDRTTSTLLGALLHDTVEDTWMGLSYIESVFGKKTAELVDLVTHLQKVPGSLYKIRLSAAENLQMLERSGNRPGLLIKLADRLHNMRTIHGHENAEKKRSIAEETMQFFVPLAERMEVQAFAEELKQHCSKVLGPDQDT